jgi:hypothetical protein
VPNPIPSPIPEKTSRGKILTRIRQWALSRLVIEAAVLVITVALMSRVLRLFVPPEPSPLHNRLAILRNLLVAALLLGAYPLTVWWMERRSAVELDVRKGSVQLPLGAMIGVALMAVVYGSSGWQELPPSGLERVWMVSASAWSPPSSRPYSKSSCSVQCSFALSSRHAEPPSR